MTAEQLVDEIRKLNNQIRIFYNLHKQAFQAMHNLIEERDRLQDRLLEFPSEVLDRIEI